jgi:hypothetical protein
MDRARRDLGVARALDAGARGVRTPACFERRFASFSW